MSRAERTLILGGTLAAINLTGTMALVKAKDKPISNPIRPAAADRRPCEGWLAAPSGSNQPAHHGWRCRAVAYQGAGRGALASPGERPDEARCAQRAVRVPGRVLGGTGRHSGAGPHSGRQADEPPGWGRSDRLTTLRSPTRWGCCPPGSLIPCQGKWLSGSGQETRPEADGLIRQSLVSLARSQARRRSLSEGRSYRGHDALITGRPNGHPFSIADSRGPLTVPVGWRSCQADLVDPERRYPQNLYRPTS
jgi:hypothetical protein